MSLALFLPTQVVKTKRTHRKHNARSSNMTRRRSVPVLSAAAATLSLVVMLPGWAYAAVVGGMPWDGPLDQIRASICGPTAKNLIFIAIAVLGISTAFMEGGGFLKKCFMVALGVVIATSGGQWFMSRVGFGGGLGI
jgi:type IV secretory pathway VirB2 component (pilin)